MTGRMSPCVLGLSSFNFATQLDSVVLVTSMHFSPSGSPFQSTVPGVTSLNINVRPAAGKESEKTYLFYFTLTAVPLPATLSLRRGVPGVQRGH